jgi:two-component system, NarL family, nitrate/nitrite response regulator NarL
MPESSSLHVLLVEDDLVFQATFRRVFALLGGDWKIHAHQTGRGALEALDAAGHRFELALIDIGLPDISGVEVVARLRQRFADLPILVTTVFSGEETFLSAIRAGARGYLLKGDSDSQLAQAIEQIMRGEYPVSPALARHLFRLAGSSQTLSPAIKLSPRELELLQWLSKGDSYASCAQKMGISFSTVQTHIRNMYRKLDVSNQRQAIHKAQSSGLLHP